MKHIKKNIFEKYNKMQSNITVNSTQVLIKRFNRNNFKKLKYNSI